MMRIHSRTASRAVSLLLALLALFTIRVPAAYAAEFHPSDVTLTFQLTEVPADYRLDVTVYLMNTTTDTEYEVSAHYMGDYTNTASITTGHYEVTGAKANDYEGVGYMLTIDQTSFDVTGNMTLTGKLELGSSSQEQDGFDGEEEPLTVGGVPLTGSTELVESGGEELEQTEQEQAEPEQTAEPDAEQVTEPVTEQDEEQSAEQTTEAAPESDNLEGELEIVALVLVILAVTIGISALVVALRNRANKL